MNALHEQPLEHRVGPPVGFAAQRQRRYVRHRAFRVRHAGIHDFNALEQGAVLRAEADVHRRLQPVHPREIAHRPL